MVQLEYTKEEICAQLMLDKDVAQRSMEVASVKYLQNWFRNRKRMMAVQRESDGGRNAHSVHQVHLMKQAFLATKQAARAEASNLLADEVKIDQLADRCTELVEAVEAVRRRTDPAYAHESDSEEEELTGFEQSAKWKAKKINKDKTEKTQDVLRLPVNAKGGSLRSVMASILLQKRNQLTVDIAKNNMGAILHEAAHMG